MYLKLTANPALGKGGSTFGGSGGPILDAGADVVLGEDSFVTDNCDGVTDTQRLDIPDVRLNQQLRRADGAVSAPAAGARSRKRDPRGFRQAWKGDS